MMRYEDWHQLERSAYLWAMVAGDLLNKPDEAEKLREHAEDFGRRAVAAEMNYERTHYGILEQSSGADEGHRYAPLTDCDVPEMRTG